MSVASGQLEEEFERVNETDRSGSVVDIDYDHKTVTLNLLGGSVDGQFTLYLHTDASSELVAALESSTYTPNLNAAPGIASDEPPSARAAIVPVVNGIRGASRHSAGVFMSFQIIRSPKTWWAVVVLGAVGVTVWRSPLYGAESPVVIAPPIVDIPKSAGPPQTAVLAGGCFWGVQGVFEHVHGVRQVLAGYAGGELANARYEIVSSGSTGHAESVKITFDPAEISYGQILQIAFSVVHDPTQLNRQGPDSGSQYRSAIFYADEDQKHIAETYIAQLTRAHSFPRPIVTRVTPLEAFYPAEEYHQDYLMHHPDQPYIAYNDLPKVENLRRTFPYLYSEHPALTATR